MRVFISWSKEPSRIVAESLRDWLPDVIQSIEPWMSSADIGAGARWSTKVAEALAATKIGILCVTADNQREPWLLFEAGALAKTLTDTFVCPYLIQMRTADLSPGPLTQFQAKLSDQEGTFDLVSTVNTALGPDALAPERLRRLFERSWPHLEAKLKALPPSPPSVHRSSDELLTEILETVRSLSRRLPPDPGDRPGRLPKSRVIQVHRVRQLLRDIMPESELRELNPILRNLSDDDLEKLMTSLRGHSAETRKSMINTLLRVLTSPPVPAPQSNAEVSASLPPVSQRGLNDPTE